MATRPYWTGQIRLSLVSLPVHVYAAVNSARQIPLHEIYRPTGERVRHQNVANDEPIEREDIVKGYEYEKGEYVLIEPEEIDELKVPSKKTMEIVRFVDAGGIDAIYLDRPYFVAPDGDEAEEAFIIIREALRSMGKVGLGQLAIAGRERLCALKPCGSGMLLETLRYKDEIRASDPYFDEIDKISINKEQLSLAKELIRRKSGKFDPSMFHDHYREALQELIDSKIEDRPMREIAEEAPRGKVVNLMDALKRSLGSSGEGKKKAPIRSKAKKAAPKTKKRAAPKTAAVKKAPLKRRRAG